MDIDIARYRADSFELTRYVYVYIERESGGERGGGRINPNPDSRESEGGVRVKRLALRSDT